MAEQSGAMVNLFIPDICFSHDSQREHFGVAKAKGEDHCRGVLQLAVELLLGITLPGEVPAFCVCNHAGMWFCYSGNRRLAAFRLAHRFCPDRFTRLMLPAVALGDGDSDTRRDFLDGGRFQKKLTTGRNGPKCCGQWLLMIETGEAVGRSLPGCAEYGCDLLELLPLKAVPEILHWTLDRPYGLCSVNVLRFSKHMAEKCCREGLV